MSVSLSSHGWLSGLPCLGTPDISLMLFSVLPLENMPKLANLLECWGGKMLYLWRAHYSPSFSISPSWCYHHGHGIDLASSSISHEKFWQPMGHLFYISSPRSQKRLEMLFANLKEAMNSIAFSVSLEDPLLSLIQWIACGHNHPSSSGPQNLHIQLQ